MKARCEICNCIPHVPRRRCVECGKLVCVSNCWNRRWQKCANCTITSVNVRHNEPHKEVRPTYSGGPIAKAPTTGPLITANRERAIYLREKYANLKHSDIQNK